MLKAVLDTNILVSGLLRTSPNCSVILEKFAHNAFTLVISPAILEEYIDVISRPKFRHIITAKSAREIVEIINARAFWVNPSEKLQAIPEDDDDNRFLEAALASGSNVIVSGDTHLLALKTFRRIPILSAKEFLARL